MLLPNLLLIAGTGNKSGKTSAACRIIRSFPDLSITAIKITPHFHETTMGLVAVAESDGYSIYEETNRENGKDTARMLESGASRVYFAKVWDDKLLAAFLKIREIIPEDMPVICESPALRNFIEPGVFIIMTSDKTYNKKNIKHLKRLPHLMIKLEELDKIASLPFGFEGGKWFLKSEVRSPKSEDLLITDH